MRDSAQADSMGENFSERPTLQLRKRTGFDDADAVTNFGLAAFVMHVVFLRAFDDFIEAWMRNTCDVLDNESLVHFIGDDHADAGFAKVDLSVCRIVAHDENKWGVRMEDQALFRVEITVMTWATSRRT